MGADYDFPRGRVGVCRGCVEGVGGGVEVVEG